MNLYKAVVNSEGSVEIEHVRIWEFLTGTLLFGHTISPLFTCESPVRAEHVFFHGRKLRSTRAYLYTWTWWCLCNAHSKTQWIFICSDALLCLCTPWLRVTTFLFSDIAQKLMWKPMWLASAAIVWNMRGRQGFCYVIHFLFTRCVYVRQYVCVGVHVCVCVLQDVIHLNENVHYVVIALLLFKQLCSCRDGQLI